MTIKRVRRAAAVTVVRLADHLNFGTDPKTKRLHCLSCGSEMGWSNKGGLPTFGCPAGCPVKVDRTVRR
jgi:hypothetical protein